MIPLVVPIGKDQDFEDWTMRLAENMCYSYRHFVKQYYGQELQRWQTHFGNYSQICKWHDREMPALKDILLSHDPWSASAVFAPTYSIGLSFRRAMLGRDQMNAFEVPLTRNANRYCPLCVREDAEHEQWITMHTPHQIRIVDCCLKHRVKLISAPKNVKSRDKYLEIIKNMEPVKATASEIRVAEMMETLYQKRITGDDSVLRRLLEKHYPKVKAKYWWTKAYLGANAALVAENVPAEEIVQACRNAERGLTAIAAKRLRAVKTEILETDYPVLYCRCKSCKTEYPVHVISAKAGMGCPVCEKKLGRRELFNRRMDSLYGGKWKIEEIQDDKMEVPIRKTTQATFQHGCGSTVLNNLSDALNYGISCPDCQSHIGEETVTKNDERIKIINYHSFKRIKVVFEDGTVVNTTYSKFKDGTVLKYRGKREERVGETRQMSNGEYATVIDYKSARNMTVKFEDTTEVPGVRYQHFKNGAVAKVPRRKKK